MKRLSVVVAAVALTAAWACGGAEKTADPVAPKKLRFALIPKALDIPVFDYAKVGAEREAAAQADFEVIYRGPDHADELAQKQVLESLIQQKVDGIAITVLKAEFISSTIDKAVEAGSPVVTARVIALVKTARPPSCGSFSRSAMTTRLWAADES